MNARGVWIIAGVIIALFLIGAYLSFSTKVNPNSKNGSESSQLGPGENEPSSTSSSGEKFTGLEGGAVVEVTMEANEFRFEPAVIEISQGQEINLTLVNRGSSPHNFVIDELNINTPLVSVGESDTFSFLASEPGVYQYYCRVANHRNLGMEGQLIINPINSELID